MPKKTVTENPYGYDPETGTVRVRKHDLERLLLTGSRWEGPDLRLRCTTTEAVYDWPDGAPYDGGAPVTWNVPGYGSHAADDDSGHLLKSLCGFSWAEGEGRVVNGLPNCRDCLREVQLGAERPRGSW